MRFKYRVKQALQFLSFAFYPKTTLVACAAFSAIVIGILGIVMAAIPPGSNWYNIVFALTTGAAGSFFVSFVIELANNYRHNKLAWHALQEYYSVVMDYEVHKQVMMQMTPHQRARKKAHEEFLAAGGAEEIDACEKPKDIIQITWKQLPEIIPVFRQTLHEKKEFLSDGEIVELENILSEYKEIQFAVRERILLSSMTYDAINHPDEAYLKSVYPSDVIGNMPEWIRKYLSSIESQKACDRYAEAILSDGFLLSRFMENYDISQRGLARYRGEIKRMEEGESEPESEPKSESESEDIDYEDFDFSAEPEDEEAFRAENEAFEKQMELEQRPFVSGQLSRCCQNISESVDRLEKYILKKPYYGMMIQKFKDSASAPIDDPLSMVSYESEKRRLEKRAEVREGRAN